uniref:Uncharacterized protein n=1 Tax=Coccidioides posadasii RMSCC 3488 TaxID=454284 RepID=A0A0J6F6A0_COCPO|nr:hypothetical protein CPAG_00831 [Coccidioides posadasii RMSCC 3488]
MRNIWKFRRASDPPLSRLASGHGESDPSLESLLYILPERAFLFVKNRGSRCTVHATRKAHTSKTDKGVSKTSPPIAEPGSISTIEFTCYLLPGKVKATKGSQRNSWDKKNWHWIVTIIFSNDRLPQTGGFST